MTATGLSNLFVVDSCFFMFACLFIYPVGGTTVSGAVGCPAHEQRMVVSLDTSQMVRRLVLLLAMGYLLRRICVGISSGTKQASFTLD